MLLFVVVAAVLASTPSLALDSDPFALDLAFTAVLSYHFLHDLIRRRCI
jgi:hypothetical protein